MGIRGIISSSLLVSRNTVKRYIRIYIERELERLLKMDEHHLYEFSLLRLTMNQQYLQSIIIFKNIYSTLNDLNPVEQLVWGLSEKPFPRLQLLFILLIYQTWKGSKNTCWTHSSYSVWSDVSGFFRQECANPNTRLWLKMP